MKEILKGLFLFKNCDFDAVDSEMKLCEKVKELTFSAGEIILSNKTPYRGIFTVVSGSAAVTSGNPRSAVLRSLHRCDTFGAASVFCDDNLYKTSVTALSECKLLLIDRQTCETLVCHYPACANNLIGFLSGRIAFLNRKITAFTAGTAEEKTAIWILSLPVSENGERVVKSYSEAASSLCLGRASLYRALDVLEAKGLIKRNAKIITVTNEPALTALF